MNPLVTAFDGITTAVTDGLSGLGPQLLLLVPAALGVTAITWGTPKAIRFFKGLAK